jgi:hypothetical protein
VTKLQEKIESALFLRDLAEAARRYRNGEADSGVRVESVPRPQGKPQRLAERLKRLARR